MVLDFLVFWHFANLGFLLILLPLSIFSAKIQALRLKEFKLALESENIQNDSLKQRAAALEQMKPSGGSGQA